MVTKYNNNGANLGFERDLWQAADALRSNMDAAEYKHIVLGLIFLKYISDAFEEQYAKLQAEKSLGADPEDPDEYRAVNIFWVPGKARWPHLIEDVEEDGEPFDEKMERLTSELAEMFAKSQHLEEEIRKNQALIGWEI